MFECNKLYHDTLIEFEDFFFRFYTGAITMYITVFIQFNIKAMQISNIVH